MAHVPMQVYQSGMRDLYDMMQSATFMQHIGYGALKILLTNIFPELRHKFLQVLCLMALQSLSVRAFQVTECQ